MKLINYPKRAVELANLNAGDIILADTLEPNDKGSSPHTGSSDFLTRGNTCQ